MGKDYPLVILSSARKNSDTKKVVDAVFENTAHDTLDLLDYKISHFNYAKKYPADDKFISAIEKIIAYKVLIFATPIYWYSMSGLMKVFFDRLTDVVSVRKELGRNFKGKHTFLISSGSNEKLPTGFEVPFRSSSEYLNMQYNTYFYHSVEKDFAKIRMKSKYFIEKIKKASV